MSNNINKSKLISSGCFKQYCDYDIPYCGIIDDGKGTTALVNSDVEVVKRLDGNVLYYSKCIKLKVEKVTHIVRKGDSIWRLAEKLGVSVEDIVSSNKIKDSNFINVGDVLNINVDIQYGYQVESKIDLDSFSDKAREYGYTPLSESNLYQVLETIHSYADGFGSTLADNAGKSRIGNNFNLYVEQSSGRVFGGNQYVRTYGISEIGNSITKYTQPLKIGKVALPLAIAFEGVEIYDGYQQDNQSFGYNAQKQTVGAAGAITGGLLGAKYGATIGVVIGTAFFGIGAVPAAIIGGFIGGIVGGLLGESMSEYGYEKASTLIK